MLDRAGDARGQAAHRGDAAARSGAEADFETAYGQTTHNVYGMCAMRHMHDYGTTPSSSPGSRSRPRTTPNTIRMRC